MSAEPLRLAFERWFVEFYAGRWDLLLENERAAMLQHQWDLFWEMYCGVYDELNREWAGREAEDVAASNQDLQPGCDI